MKKIMINIFIIILIIAIIVCTCMYVGKRKKEFDINYIDNLSFTGLDDSNLQDYILENFYSCMNSNFSTDDYIIENITTTYVSKEYLKELDYNSKSNIYFGYTLDELANQFNGKKYVFQVDDNNKTTVAEFEEYNDVYAKMIKNVAIGTGVVLVCATVSVVTGGTMSIVFAASAKTATEFALSSMAISGTISSAVEYYKTGDVKKSLEKGALDGTESFKWGAIIGSIGGGVSETITQVKAAKELKNMNFIERGARAETRALKKYGGTDQVSYLNGVEVPKSTINATRPDIIRKVNGNIEAIEVKNYNLNSYLSREGLYKELSRQVTDRVKNLPSGSTQRIVLDVQGRNYSKELINEVKSKIIDACSGVYKNIPVDIMT